MGNDNIKRLYGEAANLHAQAKAILDEYAGKELPKEKGEEVDRLFDAVEAKTAEAKRYERADQQDAFLNDADAKNRKSAFNEADDDDDPKNAADKKKAKDDVAVVAFKKILQGGDRAWFGLSDDERKAIMPLDKKDLSADTSSAGGTLVAPQQWVAQLLKGVDDEVYVRALATKFQVATAQSLGVPVLDADISDADWTTEILTGNKDTAFGTGKRELYPHPLAKRVLVSRKLLRQSTIPADALIRDRLSYKFGVSQEKAFLTGTGVGQPLGVFTPSALGISTGRDTTTASATAVTGDELIDVAYSLKPQYLKKASWLLHRTILKAVRKLKATTGDYVWQPGLAGDKQPTLLERPYILSEYAPSSLTASQYIALLGDFSFYWIADALSMEVQVVDQLYAESNQMGYIGRMETDGMPVLEEAFARLITHS